MSQDIRLHSRELILLMRLLLFVVFICLICLVHGRIGRKGRTRRSPPPARKEMPNKGRTMHGVDVPNPVSYDIEPTRRHGFSQNTRDDFGTDWMYGGHTVLSDKSVQLTPPSSNRRGWLWNIHPIQVKNWEMEVEVKVSSQPAYGGEGLGIWFLHKSMDPRTFREELDCLGGPIMGLKEDFKGFGVVLDVYDNDNMRDNPQLHVIENLRGVETKKFDHDKDFAYSLHKHMPDGDDLTGHKIEEGTLYRAYKCLADIRNTGQPANIVLKYIDHVLHVYLNEKTRSQDIYRFCLAVQFDKEHNFEKDYHLAFSANTGQVADTHEIVSVTTRYLSDDIEQVDDTINDSIEYYNTTNAFSGILVLVSLCLVFIVGYQYQQLSTMLKQQIDTVVICNTVNPWNLPHYATQACVILLMMFSGYWWSFFMNLPITCFHAYKIIKQQYNYRAYLLAKFKNTKFSWQAPHSQLMMLVVWYGVSCMYFFIYEIF